MRRSAVRWWAREYLLRRKWGYGYRRKSYPIGAEDVEAWVESRKPRWMLWRRSRTWRQGIEWGYGYWRGA